MKTATLPSFVGRDGIDYDAFPPPHPLFRAMKYTYATKLLHQGNIRLGRIDVYKKQEERTLGQSDPREGTAILLDHGNPHRISGLLHTYILCTSTAEADHRRLLEMDREYETIVQINDPHEFAHRILESTKQFRSSYSVECAHAVYDKGEADLPRMADELDLSYRYNFQKDRGYSWQHEYRFAVTDLGHQCLFGQYMDLELGCCKRLVKIIR